MSLTNSQQIQILKNHFNLFYRKVVESKPIPEAKFEQLNGIYRCLTGISMPYYNALIGCPPHKDDWETLINDQIQYFTKSTMPFVWYVDKSESPQFKETLLEFGFKDSGIFQGVIGDLKSSYPIPEVSNSIKFEMVKDEQTLNQFNELVCATFGLHGVSKDQYKEVIERFSKGHKPSLFNWIAKKDGKAISAVSTLIENDLVSVWNCATPPEYRCQGLCTALSSMALNHATSKSCKIGMSYLMSEGLALGIFTKLGYQSKWHFHALLSPLQCGPM